MSIGFKKLEEEKPKTSWVETGTEIFAFINVIILSIGIVTCLGLIGCTTISQVFTDEPNQALLWYLCLGCGVTTSIVFVFAVLLFLGVYQKNPSFLLAYFIFGVLILTLMVATVVSFDFVHLDIDKIFRDIYNDFDCKWVLIVVSVVYTFVLGMVLYTYVLMRSNQKRKSVV